MRRVAFTLTGSAWLVQDQGDIAGAVENRVIEEMNAVFLTQSSSLTMFYDLMLALREPLELDRVGFYVSDSRFYRQFKAQCPAIESGRHHLLKEWEITGRAKHGVPDLALIRRYENALGDPTLWDPLVADRRVYLGKRCALRQDYCPRFNHDQMLRILEEGLVATEQFFDEVQPDVVISFICVTFGEYLAYLFAAAREIPFLNLRPTRIKNYVTCGNTIFEPSERIKSTYEAYRASGSKDQWTTEAREYTEYVRSGHAKYEGVIGPSRTPPGAKMSIRGLPLKLVNLLRTEYAYYFGGLKEDNHLVDPLMAMVYRRLLNPLRARRVHRKLGHSYLLTEDLAGLDYVFFPLHTEPEVTLLVYSKPYLNQIEVIRNLSHAVPVGMKVVVKEHPAAVGKRPLSYYEKILQIPNVRLADPALDSRTLIEQARLVATIAGSIGLEALLRRKPVLTFGRTPYGYLPDSMTRRVVALDALASDVDVLLNGYSCDERALLSFVAATMRESAPMNLYSNLLGKRGVYVVAQQQDTVSDEWQQDIHTLARYTVASLVELGAPVSYAAP